MNSDKKVLALRHLLRPLPWGLPGGFIDGGEQPSDAIRRELQEEVGLEIEDLRLLQLRTVGRHIEIMFAATSQEEPRIASSEIEEAGWYTLEELPDRLPADQFDLARKVVRGEV